MTTPTFAMQRVLPRGRLRIRRPGLLAPLALGLAAIGAAPVQAAPRLRGIDFLPAVQSIAQNARVVLVNLAPTAGRVNVPPDPCRVAVTFLDASGEAIGASQVLAIARGHTATVVAPVFVGAAVPTAIRAQVTVPPGPPIFPPDPCADLHGSYELFDTQTLETKLIVPDPVRVFVPQPEPG